MAADSAISVPTMLPVERQYIYRVYYGATKLRPIPRLQAGISHWGQFRIRDMDTDVWILDFIRRNEDHYNSLEEFAFLLRDELRRNIERITNQEDLRWGTIGFHVAGFVDFEGEMTPTFWHIHNGQSEEYQDIDSTIVNANNDLPPDRVIGVLDEVTRRGNEAWPTVRNGDIQTLYIPFFGAIRPLLDFLRSQDVQIPTQTLQGRVEFLAFQIRTIRDLYRLSRELLPHIGGEMVTLTISSEGIQNYWNPSNTTL